MAATKRNESHQKKWFDDDDELFLCYGLTDERHLVLFPAGTIVRNPHHRESPAHRQQVLNLRRT